MVNLENIYTFYALSGPLTRVEFKYRGYISILAINFQLPEILDKKIVKENNWETTVYTVKSRSLWKFWSRNVVAKSGRLYLSNTKF